MAIFAITFRIHNDATYERRYNSVVEAIKKQTTSKYWDEPTSFFLIENSLNSTDLANSINQSSELNEDRDLLLVVNLSAKGYQAVGLVRDDDIHELMKKR